MEIDDSETQKRWLKSARGRKAAEGEDWLAGAELPHAHGYRVIPAAVRDGRIVQAPTTPARAGEAAPGSTTIYKQG